MTRVCMRCGTPYHRDGDFAATVKYGYCKQCEEKQYFTTEAEYKKRNE